MISLVVLNPLGTKLFKCLKIKVGWKVMIILNKFAIFYHWDVFAVGANTVLNIHKIAIN